MSQHWWSTWADVDVSNSASNPGVASPTHNLYHYTFFPLNEHISLYVVVVMNGPNTTQAESNTGCHAEDYIKED